MSDRRLRVALAVLAIAAGVAVFAVSTTVYPHHSPNHDEGVYLQQAALLLDGQLAMEAPLPDAVQPWFFVQDGTRLYPKYSPVPAAVFALGMAVGIPRLSLALVATLSVGLVGLVTAEAFDRETGLLAAGLFVTAPLFLVNASLFLPYAPTTLLNLLFALGYLRSCRAETTRGRRGYAALAGAAIGVSFFARPYTAVLFALPFVAHALVTLIAAWRRDAARRPVTERYAVVGSLGLLFVGVTVAYNARMTGDPLVFPYQAFAPQDGIGFGERQILGYERQYTPTLALEANGRVVWQLLTSWGPVPPLGTLLAAIGVGRLLAGLRTHSLSVDPGRVVPVEARTLLAGLFVTVTAGNVFFWGNLNVLAALDDPTDGLIALVGPFYHFDLLLPLAAFGAAGALACSRWLRERAASRISERQARLAVGSVVALVVLLAGVTTVAAVETPMDRQQPYTERYERAYEPFQKRPLTDAVVFVPTPYGEWLNHPFQSLRNSPDLAGRVVYALDRGPEENFAVLDHYDGRRPYRYTYRGEWTPEPTAEPIQAKLQPVSVTSSGRFEIDTTVGTAAGAESATVRLAADDDSVMYGVERLSENVTISWVVGPGRVRIREQNLQRFSDGSTVAFSNASELVLTVTFTQAGGSTVTYREELTADPENGSVRLVWPPESRVCRLVTACGYEGTYIQDEGDYVAGVSMHSEITRRYDANATQVRP